jgi:uroporphyrinogen-III decarboxylase
MPTRAQIERIENLIERYLDVVHSERNQRNLKRWKSPYNWNRDMWRGIPAERTGPVPFTVAPDNSLWNRLIGINFVSYYSDPCYHVESQLRMKLFHAEHFTDNTPFTDELWIWFGVVTELSLFGCEVEFMEHKEPWIRRSGLPPGISAEELEAPDFKKSAVMPRVHEFYESVREVSKGRLRVMFPDFVRGPFCLLVHILGFTNALYALMDSPEWVHRLMQYFVNGTKSWVKERNIFLGDTIRPCRLYEDEIDCPTISPRIYDQMVFPYEADLARHCGGVSYWHSCGNTTAFMKSIKHLPGLQMFHVGPYTSYAEADRIFGDEVCIEICLNPQKDVLEADTETMRNKIRDIKNVCRHGNYTIRIDGLMPHGKVQEDLEKIKQWCWIAQEELAAR